MWIISIDEVFGGSIWFEYWYAAGPHNMQSFLAANSTQNYFFIARMIIFYDIRDKSDVFDILRQNETIFDTENG